MKKILSLLIVVFFVTVFSGQSKSVKKPAVKTTVSVSKPNPDLEKINDSIPALIPQKKNGLFGFVNQRGKVIIPYQYSNVGFFAEDCNLLNSPNEKVRKFGSNKYSSVRKAGVDYRINMAGKIAYRYKDSDLAKCPFEYKEQMFHSYVRQGYYGVIDRKNFENEMDYRQYIIYPQFQYLHILEGDDLRNPMIIAVLDNKFGVINIEGKVVIPFIYADIKRNFSWKLARLFEVTMDGKEYFFIDDKNMAY